MGIKTIFSATATVALLSGAAWAQDPDLLVFDWSGYEEPDFYTQYTEENGQGPSFAFFGEEEEAFQKLRSGFKADVSHPCSQSVEKWRAAGLLEPWDISKVPSYATVADIYKQNKIFADDTGVYFIPADLGATAIAYNTEEVPAEEVKTLQVFLDPKYAGRMSLPDNVDDIYSLAYLATGTTDWTKATQEDFEKASAWLREAHANVRTYWADTAELQQLMSSGEVLLAWSWNDTPIPLQNDGLPFAFERSPKEGSSIWTCGYVNLKDGPGSEDKAHQFIEAWLQPHTADYIVHEWGYGHSNTVAMSEIPQQDLDDAGLGPVDVPLLAQLPMDNALREQMIEEFEKIKAGF